jgi:signal transduction histidine kinase
MLRSLLAKLTRASASGERSERASIIVPFLIIAAGLGVLAWRSYQLSVKMERGADTIAVKYANYAAEITANRVDAAVRAELLRASDEWQQVERRQPGPSFGSLQEWINRNDWIVSAMYTPDADSVSSIYVSEIPTKEQAAQRERQSREFYTAGGTVRYTYDPVRLLARVRSAIRQKPLPDSPGDLDIQQQADIALVPLPPRPGPLKIPDGFAFVAPLSSPLSQYGVRATVRTPYIGAGWENPRIISFVTCIIAMLITGLGALLSMRGLRKEGETMKLRAALIANVSHELRTPLSMIRLGAETLRRGTKLKQHERDEIEDQILREVLHLSHLVENVLDVARMQHKQTRALAFTPVHPRDLVVSVVTTYESWIRSKGFNVALQIDDAIEEQLWDREAVSRALLNLIDNAIKYSDDQKSIEVMLRQTADSVVIEVRDRGIGINAKELSRIFDPYYRAQFSDTQTRRGAGLGLTLVQQIVVSHGGHVEVESEPGKGSTFRLLFPRISAEDPRPVARLVQAPEAF